MRCFSKLLYGSGKFLIVCSIILIFMGNGYAQIRVMPLGDAIVLGTGSSGNNVGGFRDDLYNRMLFSYTMPFDFVGSLNDGFSIDPHHEGHAGMTVAQINQNLPIRLQQYLPHQIIIHLGTEDLIQGGDPNTIVTNLTATINLISNFSSETEIYMSTLVPNKNLIINSNINQLNLQIQALVSSQRLLGKNIYLVDVNQSFISNLNWMNDYMNDDNYPNDLGYTIMANNYFDEMSIFSSIINMVTYTDNFDGRLNLGLKWSANGSFEIQTDELVNASTQYLWDNALACFNALVSPNTIEFRISDSANLGGIAEMGIAVLLDSASIYSDGYLIVMNNNLLNLYELNQGLIGAHLDWVDIGTTFPQPGNLCRVKIIVNSEDYFFSTYINDVLVGTVTHSPDFIRPHFGGVMMRGGIELNNNIDDFRVSNVVDEKPPAKISDLSVIRTGTAVVELQWTATGDDSLTGQITSYDLRYATFPIEDYNFNQAVYVDLIQSPSSPQTVENTFVSGLQPNTNYYFAIKAVDDNNNNSEISTTVQTTTNDAVFFFDDFARAAPGPQWEINAGVEIVDGKLITSQTGSDWNSHAILKSPNNAFEIGFQWSNSTASNQVEKAGLLLKLNSDNPGASGYFIKWVQLSHEFRLMSLIQGVETDLLSTLSVGSQNVNPGDYIKVFYYSEANNFFVVIFVNDRYFGELVDSNNIFGDNDPNYCGVLLQGNSSVEVENYFLYSPVLQPSQLLYYSGADQVDTVGQALNLPLEVQVLDVSTNPVFFGKVQYEVVSGDASLLAATFPDGTIYLEAEDSTPTAPMEIVQDATASGGAYIVTPQSSGDNGSAAYTFYVSSPGNYVIWGRCIVPSGTSDSFFIQVDDEPDVIWFVFQGGNYVNWEWDLVSAVGAGTGYVPEFDPYIVYLNEGIHNIIVKRRDPGTKLDKLIITKNPLLSPVGKEEVSGYPSDFSGISHTFLKLGPQAGIISVRAWMAELPGQEVNFQIQSIPDSAYQIVAVSGNNQSGSAGNPLSQPFIVKVSDQYGNVRPNQSVDFIVTQGNGQISGQQSVLTDANGEASATLILATNLPENRVEARVNGLVGSPVEFVANATSGLPTTIKYVSGSDQTGGVGAAATAPLVVKIVDDQDNPIAGYSVSFENRSSNGGTLSGDTAITGANGQAEIFFTFGITMGQYQVAALAEGLLNSPITFSLNAGPGPAYQITKVSGDSSVGISSRSLINPFIVRVQDQYGNDKYGESVTFIVTAGDGYFDGHGNQIPVVTDSSGLASATLTLGPVTGNYNNKVQAVKNGLQGSPLEFVASALPPTASHLFIQDGGGQIGVINDTLQSPLRVRVTNAVGEPAVGHPVVFHVVSGNGIFMGSMDTVQTTATNNQGIAETQFKCGPIAGENVNVIKVTSKVGSASLIGSPVWFNISAKYLGVKISEVRGNNQKALVGTQLPVPLEVLIVDAQDNPVFNQQVKFHLNAGGGKLDNGSDTVIVKHTGYTGKASVVLTLGSENGFNNNIVTVSADDGFLPLQGSPITFLASAASTNAVNLVKLDGDSQIGVVGKVLTTSIMVKVTDQLNQPVTGQEVLFNIVAGGGRLQGAQNDTLLSFITAADGVAQATWILGIIAGQQNNQLRVSATDGAEALNGSPALFISSALPDVTDPNISEISASSPVIANGQDKSTIRIKLLDKYRNPIAGKNVVLTASGEGVFIQQPSSTTNDSGLTIGYLTSFRPGIKMIYARNSSDNVLLTNFAAIEFTANTASLVNVFAGNGQSRNVGTALANPFVVSVTDNFENPISNYPVTFRANTGNGYIINPQPVFTDSLGMASSYYVLDDNPGRNVIEADAGELTGSPALFTAVGENNPGYRIVERSGNYQAGGAGQQLSEPLSVYILDQWDNPVKNVTVLFQAFFGNGQVVDPQPVKTDGYGMAQSVVKLGTKIGTDLFTASSAGIISSPLTFIVNVNPDIAAKLEIITGDEQTVNLQTQSQPLTVKVMDQFSNPVPNVQVEFEILSGAATIVTPQPVYSNSQGEANSRILTQTTSGEVMVRAKVVSIPDVHVLFSVQVLPAAPENLLIFGKQNLVVTVGRQTVEPLQARVTDQFDNPVPNVRVNFIIASGEASVSGSTEKYTFTDGIARCYINVGNIASSIEVYVSSPSDPGGTLLTYHLTSVFNNFPTMIDISNYQISEMENLQFQVIASDQDGDSLLFSIVGKPEGAGFVLLDGVTWQFNWTPDQNQNGVYPVIISVFDAFGGGVIDTVWIEVLNVNQKPVITYYYPPGDTTLLHGEEITFRVAATDLDEESLSFSWQKNGEVVSDSSFFVYYSYPEFSGQDNIVVFVYDAQDTAKHEWVVSVVSDVELIDLVAIPDQQNKRIEIYWQTTKEVNHLGFEVWRSPKKDDLYRQISSLIIPAYEPGDYSFIDDSVQAGIRYYYKIVDKSIFGVKTEHGPVQAMIAMPAFYQLEQNYPNPFTLNTGLKRTIVTFQLPKKEIVTIRIFNILGKQVRTLVKKKYLPGYHSIPWDGRDNSGRLVTSGIYYYEFFTKNFKEIKRLVLIR